MIILTLEPSQYDVIVDALNNHKMMLINLGCCPEMIEKIAHVLDNIVVEEPS